LAHALNDDRAFLAGVRGNLTAGLFASATLGKAFTAAPQYR
jgi:hypothetical protein